MKTIALPIKFRHEAEEFYSTNFADVRVIVDRLSRETDKEISAKCINRAEIMFKGDLDYENPIVKTILIHELCHVTQKNLIDNTIEMSKSLDPSYIFLLESEAKVAEYLFSAELSAPSLSPCPNTLSLNWGPAGHYYTVYLMGLAAGLAPDDAQRVAFLAQVADIVDELDATKAGFDFVRNNNQWQGSNPSGANFFGMVGELAVQQGLHTLTGRSSEKETKVRKEILLASAADEFQFGLAAHAFGDSYAHRVIDNGAVMYTPPFGHAVEWLNGRDPHCPDFIGQRPGLYADYAAALGQAFTQFKKRGSPRANVDDLSAKLYAIALQPRSEDGYVSAIRMLAITACGVGMSNLAPERLTDLQTWDAAKKNFPILYRYEVKAAHRLALDWANASR